MSAELPAEDLLARVAGQDVAALSELYDRYAPRVCGLIAHILPSSNAAQEILQEVFLRLWTESPRLSPEGGSVAAWLVVTARAAALDRVRALRTGEPNAPPKDRGQAEPAAGARKLKAASLAASAAKSHRRNPEAAKTSAGAASAKRSVLPAWLPQPKEIILIDDRLVLLHKAINQLPKPQQQAVELAVFGGLTEAEIAAGMGEPLGKTQRSLRAAVTFIKHRRRAVCGTWAANI